MSIFTVKEGTENTKKLRVMEKGVKLTTFGLRQAWFSVGQDLKRSANKEILKKPRQGRVYIITGPSGRRRKHTASRPKESHANLSGKLRKSMGWKVRGRDLDFGYGVVERAPDHAKDVEEGTRNMAPRPSLANSVKANQRNTEQHLLAAVKKEFGI